MMIKIKDAKKQINPVNIQQLFLNENNNIPKKQLNEIKNFGKRVSNYVLKNPKSVTLITGQVQSGKTTAYSSVIAHLLDSDTNFIVLIPAVDNTLLRQTITRIKKIFSKKVSIYNINDLFSREKINAENCINDLMEKKPVILISLKQKKRLNQTRKIIDVISRYISNPVIIDDEGDQASFDNIIIEQRSAINDLIIKIFNSHNMMRMISVTASPMAHILSPIKNMLKPDKAFYIKPGDDYLGLEFFNSDNAVINVIKDKDGDVIAGKTNSVLPESFKKSLISFFVRTTLAHLYDGKLKTRSMLLHIEKEIKYHNIIAKKTESFIRGDLIPALKQRRKYINYIAKIANSIWKDFLEKNDFNEFLDLIISHIQFTEILSINGQSNKNEQLHEPENKNYILIGSTMLQRGITIKNLLVTYFSYRRNNTLNADTVLQRARWFGYSKMHELIDLWVTKNAIKDFISLENATNDIIEKIEYINKNDLSFKTYERSIYLPYANLKGTRDSVVKNRRTKLSRYITNYSKESSNIAEEMWKRINNIKTNKPIDNMSFIGKWFNSMDSFIEWFGKKNIDIIYKDLGFTDNDKKSFQDYLFNEKPKVYIVNMKTNKENSARYRDFEKQSIQVAQGRSDKYVGDRYWHLLPGNNFKNAIIFQVNFIINKKNYDDYVYKISIVSSERLHGYNIHAVD